MTETNTPKPVLAAAPDLLKALESFEGFVRHRINCQRSFELCDRCAELYQEARLKMHPALAKARGAPEKGARQVKRLASSRKGLRSVDALDDVYGDCQHILGTEAELIAVTGTRADGLLFAAAPDLYEALESCTKILNSIRGQLDNYGIRDLDAARAALAKARGESDAGLYPAGRTCQKCERGIAANVGGLCAACAAETTHE